MKRFESVIEVEAPTARAWEVYADVERWPDWTESVSSVELLDGALREGARARIRQPRLPVAVWTVSELDAGHSFTWVSTAPGVRTTGIHRVEPTGPDTCLVTAELTQEGPLGAVIGTVYARLTRRYLAMELAGLKRAAEKE